MPAIRWTDAADWAHFGPDPMVTSSVMATIRSAGQKEALLMALDELVFIIVKLCPSGEGRPAGQLFQSLWIGVGAAQQ